MTVAEGGVGLRQRCLRELLRTDEPLRAGSCAASLQVPPRLGTTDWNDLSALAGLAWRIRRLGRRDMRELLRSAA